MSAKIHTQHRNQVRIIGGSHRGRKLVFPDAPGLRPTPDSVRERLFNWLGQDLTGKRVLDLFAGSGALGFEAASRYAAEVVMCDTHPPAVDCLNRHRRELGWDGRIRIVRQDGIRFLLDTAHRFDVVLLDPPFAWQQWPQLFAALPSCLNVGASVYVEAAVLPEYPDYLQVYRQGKAGQSQFVLLKMQAAEI